ncbi:MAG TPA: MFS transporter [Stellaceae bacterium]|nr:MFS transporter [Stellaceae bacterium]
MQKNPLVEMLDDAPFTGRFWTVYILLCLAFALDFFDFYLVGFLVSKLGTQWHLTYLQSSIMLLAGGVGSIVGAILLAPIADAWGRRNILVVSTFICGISSVAMAGSPEGNWALFAMFRFFVGIGIGGMAAVVAVLAVEMMPTRHRSYLAGLPFVFASVGTMIAAFVSATLMAALGWRGLAVLGAAPIVVTVGTMALMPESPLWLLTKGRTEAARASMARLLDQSVQQMPPARPVLVQKPNASLIEAFSPPLRALVTFLIWAGSATANYGVYLWGPTVVAMLLHIDTGAAAAYFVFISAAGIIGRIGFAFLPIWMGRRWAGAIGGLGVAITIGCSALVGASTMGGIPTFVILLTVAALFFDGVFSILSPYTAEIFPVRLSSRGMALGQISNGVGKIAGPLVLAMIAGANNLVAPKATIEAVVPAFMFLAACGLAACIGFLIGPDSTRGSLHLGDEAEEKREESRSVA